MQSHCALPSLLKLIDATPMIKDHHRYNRVVSSRPPLRKAYELIAT